MTARQLAVLKNRQKQFLMISGSFPNYSGMNRLLNRMAEDGEITKTILKKGNRVFVNLPQMFHDPETLAPTIHGWAHELHCADLYVAHETEDLLRDWVYGPVAEMPDTLIPDRTAILNTGMVVFWEADEDSEGIPEIADKLKRYAAFAKSSGRKFYVIFSVPTKERAKAILVNALSPYSGGQFLVTVKDSFVLDPTGPVLASPKDYNRWFSLSELV